MRSVEGPTVTVAGVALSSGRMTSVTAEPAVAVPRWAAVTWSVALRIGSAFLGFQRAEIQVRGGGANVSPSRAFSPDFRSSCSTSQLDAGRVRLPGSGSGSLAASSSKRSSAEIADVMRKRGSSDGASSSSRAT